MRRRFFVLVFCVIALTVQAKDLKLKEIERLQLENIRFKIEDIQRRAVPMMHKLRDEEDKLLKKIEKRFKVDMKDYKVSIIDGRLIKIKQDPQKQQ